MASQNNSGRQFLKLNAVTIIATAVLAANRFAAYDGTHATNAGGVKDAQGITEHGAAIGEAVSAITGYSGLVEASATIAFGDYIKPAADGSGKAAVGTAAEHCGRALGAATAGQLVEVERLQHLHAAA
ncbi:DUF2190 domain-containing protein [Variovorax boronicumulans]|uniref:DUF2190 domain-containing protein n=1 Tax=Variovorax boronicumulans TaxID=436515 RepID=UPI001C58CED3